MYALNVVWATADELGATARASSGNRCLEGQSADNAPSPLPSKGDGRGRSNAPCCGSWLGAFFLM